MKKVMTLVVALALAPSTVALAQDTSPQGSNQNQNQTTQDNTKNQVKSVTIGSRSPVTKTTKPIK